MTPVSSDAQGAKARFISIRIKLAFGFGLAFTLIFAAIFYWFYGFSINVARTQIGESLVDVLTATALKIDGDVIVDLYNNSEPTLYDDRNDEDPDNDVYFTDDPRFWEIAQFLYSVRELNQHAFHYIYVASTDPEDENDFYYVIDGLALEDPLPEWMVSFKEGDVTDSGLILRGLDGTVTGLNNPYEWRDEWWVSGYTPIYNAQGQVVAGLGVDYLAGYLREVERNILTVALPVVTVTFAVMSALVFFVSSFISAPLIRLSVVAEEYGEGHYDAVLNAEPNTSFPDEVTTLQTNLVRMADKIAQREIKLKQEVEELRIQIDHSRRDEQVKEIVDDDFFQQLQSRAGQLRARRKSEANDDSAKGISGISTTDTANTEKDRL